MNSKWIDMEDAAGYDIHHFSIPTHYQHDVDKVLIPHGFILDRVEKLAQEIAAETENPVVACCVLKGAHVFFADLISYLKKLKNKHGVNIPLSFEFIKVKSYENENSTGTVTISLSEEDLKTFKGKDLLIIEDIIDTGTTMVNLIQRLKQYEPASIRVVSLLLKKTSRSNKYVPDYVGFAIPDNFVVGYALDYNEHFRDLDHICIISQHGKTAYAV
ncbi:phosphoribosyltransferase-like protein [Cladochytrium replicatum]|nr:phosphoribosyltransferase-like protein [Cladochytrium replicatum]